MESLATNNEPNAALSLQGERIFRPVPEIWTPNPQETVDRDILYPTPYGTHQAEEYLVVRDALRAQIVHGLPQNVVDLADKVAEIDDGRRYLEHQTHFAPARLASLNGISIDVPEGQQSTTEQILRRVLDGNLVDRLYSDQATIPDHLAAFSGANVLAVEIARTIMPLGHGHQHLPAMHRRVREGILEFDPGATLHPPILERLAPMDMAYRTNKETGEVVIDAIAFEAQLGHGRLSDRSVVQAREVFMLSLRPDAAMARNDELYAEMTRSVTKQIIDAQKKRESWQHAIADDPDPIMWLIIDGYFQDEYQEQPIGDVPAIDWIRRLESTFLVANLARQQEYELQLTEEMARAAAQDRMLHSVIHGTAKPDVTYASNGRAETFRKTPPLWLREFVYPPAS